MLTEGNFTLFWNELPADLLPWCLRRHDDDRVMLLVVQAAPLFTTLMQRAMELIRGCGCLPDTGCPGCVQHTDCGEYNAVISKVCHVLCSLAVRLALMWRSWRRTEQQIPALL